MRRVVRGFWGPGRSRPKRSPDAGSGRWTGSRNCCPKRRRRAARPEPAPGSRSTAPARRPAWRRTRALLDALREAQTAQDWSDLTGTALRLVHTGGPGWQTEISGLAGGAPEFLLQSLVVTLHAPDGAEVPEAGILAVLARVWEPDFGDVSDNDVLDALEDDAGFSVGDPVVGRVGYLSPRRAALVPDSLKAAREELPGGGVLLRVADPGASEEVVTAYERLREAGALDPLPRPMDRAVL